MDNAAPQPAPLDRSYFDAYTPDQIAHRVETVGIAKARLPAVPLLALAFLAGAFIALGAMCYTVTVTGSGLGFGPTRLLGGIVFSLGLILVLVGGAELFTGNVLMVMGWADGKIGITALLRNWGLVYIGNFVGALGVAALAWAAGAYGLGDGAVGRTTLEIAKAKVGLPFEIAFFRGVLCNILVCLAVWLCFAARGVADKILAILFPISAFVALGFEHSVANMYLIPAAMLAAGGSAPAGVDIGGLIGNLVPVTLGNIIGGGVFVAAIYYIIYLRNRV